MPDRKIAPGIKDAIDFKMDLKPLTKSSLSNGVELFYINGGAEEVVQVDFVFKAGNVFENKNGVAAATNFLLKNGTTSKNAFAINEFFEYYGAFIKCSCYSETATVTVHCLSKYLSVLLPVLREIFTEAIFPENELAIFKQNRIQFLSVSLLKIDFVANRTIDEYLYGTQHPYGRSSNKEDIESTTREDLINFYQQFYLNGHCRIFAAGQLPADFETQLETHFGDLPIHQEPPVILYKTEPNPQKKQQISIDEKGVQGAIRIARPFPNRHHPDFQKVNVLNTLFGGYFGSRLMANIREEKGYTYGISSYLENYVESSAWMISTEAGKDVVDATIKEIYNEMKILCSEPIDQEELLLVKNYMMGLNLSYLDGPFHVLGRWKSLILHGLDEKYFYSSIQTIKTITSEELQILANKYLNPDEFYELVVV